MFSVKSAPPAETTSHRPPVPSIFQSPAKFNRETSIPISQTPEFTKYFVRRYGSRVYKLLVALTNRIFLRTLLFVLLPSLGPTSVCLVPRATVLFWGSWVEYCLLYGENLMACLREILLEQTANGNCIRKFHLDMRTVYADIQLRKIRVFYSLVKIWIVGTVLDSFISTLEFLARAME